MLPQKFNRYFEPFVGGGALFFYLRPSKATISDANIELYNAYFVVKNDLQPLITRLEWFQRQRISRALYERWRRIDGEKLAPEKRAARFIFLNKTCYNGLYRVNKQGRFNVPFGKYRQMPSLFDKTNLIEVRNLLRDTEIMLASYETPLQRAEPNDFVYLDPPYSVDPDALGFTSYTKESFSASDQRRLSQKFKELDRRGCFLMLSNSNTKLVRELYADFEATTVEIESGRMINCIGSERKGYRELVVMNYHPPVETLVPWMTQHN
jgi:DNA adenine methylase